MKRLAMQPELVLRMRRSHDMEDNAHGSSARPRPLFHRKCAWLLMRSGWRTLVFLIRWPCEYCKQDGSASKRPVRSAKHAIFLMGLPTPPAEHFKGQDIYELDELDESRRIINHIVRSYSVTLYAHIEGSASSMP